METALHKIQSDILVYLLFKKEARFRDLNTNQITSDHFTFHVKRLLELNFIWKNDHGSYELTTKGKELANRYDDEKNILEKQPKVTVMVIGVKKIAGQEWILMQRRSKHPFFGYMGFVSGKMRFGETVEEAAARELKEESGLSGKLKLIGVEHKMDYDQENQILDDKLFFVFRATELKGELIGTFKGGENIWMKKQSVESSEMLFDDVHQILGILNARTLQFLENKFKVSKF